jgi:hypothetical protein
MALFFKFKVLMGIRTMSSKMISEIFLKLKRTLMETSTTIVREEIKRAKMSALVSNPLK